MTFPDAGQHILWRLANRDPDDPLARHDDLDEAKRFENALNALRASDLAQLSPEQAHTLRRAVIDASVALERKQRR